MFGLRKNARKKNHGMAFWVIGAFTFAIEGMLGINAAFLIDQSIAIVATKMLYGTPLELFAALITLVISLVVGFCFIFGGMWVFSGFMDSLDDAKAYKDEYETNNWPVNMIWCLMLAVVALDFTTLLFRASYFAERGSLALFAFFVILILMPPVLGPLIHVLEHTPHNRQMAKVRTKTEQRYTASLAQIANEIDDDLLGNLLSDDKEISEEALAEHFRRQEARENEQAEAQEEEAEKKQRGQGRKNNPLSVVSRKKGA